MAVLEHSGSLVPIGPDLIVGSGAQASHRIQGQDLAARHFMVRIDPAAGAVVVPTGDACVVTVDGVQVPRTGTRLRDGSIIAAGQARFVYGQGDRVPPVGPETERQAYLVDTTARRAYRLNRRTVQLGRDAGAGIVLKDPTVSRFHADVRSEAGGYVIYSSGATGSFVNEEQVSRPRLLMDGDEIRIGRMTMVFTLTAPPGMKVHDPAGAEESSLTRRSTQLDMRAYREPSEKGLSIRLLVGMIVVLGAAVGYLLLAR